MDIIHNQSPKQIVRKRIANIDNSRPTENMLFNSYCLFSSSYIAFRNLVCEECDWSVPTFYRKLRSISALSNADKEMLLRVIVRLLTNMESEARKIFQ